MGLLSHMMRRVRLRWLGNERTIHDTAGAWAAASIALSAILYLFDFATNICTVKAYYYYSVGCKNFMDTDDPLCRPRIYNSYRFKAAFVIALFLITVAHLSNSLIFWITLSPNDHPLRLAYFLPFIHLSRLLKVLWRSTCSCNSLKDLQDGQAQSSSLYSVLGASLEAIPLFILQFGVVSALGKCHKDKLDLTITQSNIPTIMIISLMASVVSGTYNGSVAVLSLMPKHMSLAGKACIAIAGGVHTLAAMSAKAVIIVAISEFATLLPRASHEHELGYFSIAFPIFTYIFIAVISPWIFFGYLLQRPTSSIHGRMNRLIGGAHSLTLAHVSLFIGPLYVMVKYFRRSPHFYTFLMLGTLLHICVELVGLGVMLVPARYLSGRDNVLAGNVYFPYTFFVGTFSGSLLLLISSTAVLVVVMGSKLRVEEHSHQLPSSGVVQTQLVSNEQEGALILPISRQHRVVSSTRLFLLILRALLFQMLHKRATFDMNVRRATMQAPKDVETESPLGSQL